jgi:hypothetical protein
MRPCVQSARAPSRVPPDMWTFSRARAQAAWSTGAMGCRVGTALCAQRAEIAPSPYRPNSKNATLEFRTFNTTTVISNLDTDWGHPVLKASSVRSISLLASPLILCTRTTRFRKTLSHTYVTSLLSFSVLRAYSAPTCMCNFSHSLSSKKFTKNTVTCILVCYFSPLILCPPSRRFRTRLSCVHIISLYSLHRRS